MNKTVKNSLMAVSLVLAAAAGGLSTHLTTQQGSAPTASAPRSPHWTKVRADYLKDHPVCAACGGSKDLQVHHVLPFHLHPDKELDPTNLITLCESQNRLCHLRLGHAWNFKAYNLTVREDAEREAKMIENRKEE